MSSARIYNTSYRVTDRKLTPLEIACRFARECFSDPREIDQETFRGLWRGKRFMGTFVLVDGNRTYLIQCDNGEWLIEWDN